MIVQITSTTDGHFLGHVFDSEDRPIKLSEDTEMQVDRVQLLPDGLRFSNSNYSIDATPV